MNGWIVFPSLSAICQSYNSTDYDVPDLCMSLKFRILQQLLSLLFQKKEIIIKDFIILCKLVT